MNTGLHVNLIKESRVFLAWSVIWDKFFRKPRFPASSCSFLWNINFVMVNVLPITWWYLLINCSVLWTPMSDASTLVYQLDAEYRGSGCTWLTPGICADRIIFYDGCLFLITIVIILQLSQTGLMPVSHYRLEIASVFAFVSLN